MVTVACQKVYGIRKWYLLFSKILLSKYSRKLPKRFLRELLKSLRYDKIVKFNNQIVLSAFIPPFPSKAFEQYVLNLKQIVATGRPAPMHVNIGVTNKCKYNCWHCSAHYIAGKDLPPELINATMKKLQEVGTPIFQLTGGEPLLREDLIEIIKGLERSTIVISTTGYELTFEKAKELKDAGVFSLMISLDHYRPKIHDKLRGYQGAFEIAVKAVEISKKAGLYTIVSVVATREMISSGDLIKFLEFAEKLKVNEVVVFEPAPTGKLIENGNACLTEKERTKLIELHRKVNKSKKYPKVSILPHIEREENVGCTAGFGHFYIDATGNVCPCDFVPLSFGNVQEENLETILERLYKHFNKPRAFCFMLENSKKVSEKFRNLRKLPLPYQTSKEICESCSSANAPLLYRKFVR
jgi:MoaA/NifB/PqqE/SkfB family radical SAM enzyme